MNKFLLWLTKGDLPIAEYTQPTYKILLPTTQHLKIWASCHLRLDLHFLCGACTLYHVYSISNHL